MSEHMFKEVKKESARKSAQQEKITPTSPELDSNDIVNLQRVIGNQGVRRLLAGQRSGGTGGILVQTKLQVGPANDQYEQEADKVAHEVMTKPVQRQDDEEEMAMKRVQRQDDEEEMAMKRVQRKGTEAGFEVEGEVEERIKTAKGSGQSLPDEARNTFESHFGQDFSGVTVHTDKQADSLNRELDARAFTTGSDIFFREGEYKPGAQSGQELLAHELTHVVQQGGSIAKKDQGEE